MKVKISDTIRKKETKAFGLHNHSFYSENQEVKQGSCTCVRADISRSVEAHTLGM